MKAMQKDFWREIKQTKSRFFSIFVLVALAVAFLSGLRSTAPDMKRTGDAYLDAQNFMDIQVLSELGLTEEDLSFLRRQSGVHTGEGAYVIDAFARANGLDIVAKVYSLPTKLNQLTLSDGRLPVADDECAVDEKLLEGLGLTLGDSLYLATEGDFADTLAQQRFTIVGQVVSPLYISVERGTSTLGAGRVAAYAYLAPSAFTMDYYTAAYLTVNHAAEAVAFSSEYDTLVDDVVDTLKPVGKQQALSRRTDLVDEANEKLADAQIELDDAKAEAEQELSDAWAELTDARGELDDGWQDVREAKETLARETADAEQKLTDARTELTDAQIKLDDGEMEYGQGVMDYEEGTRDYADGLVRYEDGLKEYEKGEEKLSDAREQLAAAGNQLNAAHSELTTRQAQFDQLLGQLWPAVGGAVAAYGISIDSGEALLAAMTNSAVIDPSTGMTVGQVVCTAVDGAMAQMKTLLQDGINQSAVAIADLETQLQQADGAIAQLEAALALAGEAGDPALSAQLEATKNGRAQLAAGLANANATRASLQEQLTALSAVDGAGNPIPGSAYLLAAAAQLKDGWAQYEGGVISYDYGWSQYQDGKSELLDAEKELNDAKIELADAKIELADAQVKLADARVELDDGWVEFTDGQAELADGEAELITQVADARREIDDGVRDLRDGEVEYNDGLIEYQDGKAEAEEKIGDAEMELADARRKVADIGDGKWYILSRSSNPGYQGYGQDADRMGNLADLFPLLFFLVAALVCLTTMTRMVEEERVQIGSLKALGYTRWSISQKYVGYALLPSLLGGLVGLSIGYTLFPKMIFTAYQIMYQVPDIQLHAYADISTFSLLAGVGCTLLATLGACLATLTSTPANLMRPRAPKPGKRVLLEYIRPLWRRMRFTHKVTARNLLRYHLRFWMTVAGIGGCTALIIAGFGLRSSLLGAMDVQYSEIYHYTAQLSVSDNLLPEERAGLEDYLSQNPRVSAALPCHLDSVTAETEAYSLSVYLEATSPKLSDFVALRDRKGNALTVPQEGVIINQKLSEMLQVDVGDTFTVDGERRAEVTVAGITEHYLGHFIYLSPAYYEKVFATPCVQNAYLLTLTDDSAEACDTVFSGALKLPGVVATSRMLDTKDTYMRSMERIDFVVVIVILSAAALALVVLYNLSNINITERKRELATIRVLGFYDAEVSAYVNRENAVLTIFGIGFGIFCGHFLHVWLVKSVEIEMMMFVRKTDPMAYLWAGLLTIGFSVLTALLAHRKMKRIDMVESLKSAE